MNGSPTSNFSSVEFIDIPEAYGIAEPVTLRYTIANSFMASASDWIGLYRVGWRSTKDYVTYEWTNLPENYASGTQVECVCTFKDRLPTNDEDFFQFCYVNTQGKVCGASSPFQFLEDYDIVVIDETESMVMLQTTPSLAKQQTITSEEQQQRQPHTDELQLVIRQDEMEKITAELMEAKKHVMERDSQLKDLELEVNELQAELRESKEMSGRLAEDVDRLKSELVDQKEKQILAEKTFHETEKRLQVASSEFNQRELAYKEKEMELNATVQDLRKQLCQKAQELETLKLEHSSTVSMLDVKQSTVEELNKRCSKMSAENSQMKKAFENASKLKTETAESKIGKENKAVHQKPISQLQTASNGGKIQLSGKADDVTVTDGIENFTGATAEGGTIQKESSVNKAENKNLFSADYFRYIGRNRISSEKTCLVCFLTFPAGTSHQVIFDHLHSHQKVCPLCDIHIQLNCTQQEFEMHVADHLSDTVKLNDGRKICPVCEHEFPPAFAQEQFESHVYLHFGETFRSK